LLQISGHDRTFATRSGRGHGGAVRIAGFGAEVYNCAMLAITLADLRFRYRQFLIAVVGAGVVLAMAVLLAGLADGFRSELHDTVGAIGADRWVLSEKAHGRITSVSTFDAAEVQAVAAERGVRQASGLAVLPQEVMRSGSRLVTVNVLGVETGGLGVPDVHDGRTLGGAGQVVLDSRTGVSRGSVVQFGNTAFRVVGTVSDRTLNGGTPVAYMTLDDAQATLLGGRPIVTAIVTRGVPASVPSGLVSLTPARVESQTLDSLSSAVASIQKSRTMMWVIAAIIVAALVYVSALQRVRDFAVLKALGSSSTSLFVSLCLQAVIVTLVGAALGMALSTVMTGVFSQPVTVPTSAYATLPLVAVIVGIVASLVALRQATGADPVKAFAG
jgi:putative ABC transport system permease protein